MDLMCQDCPVPHKCARGCNRKHTMTDLHEKAEKLASTLERINDVCDAEAATLLRDLSTRLAEVERERDTFDHLLGAAYEVTAELIDDLDKARARVAAAYEEAASLCKVLERFPQLQAIGSTIHDDLADDIRALARPEETDALDRIRTEVWREALRIVAEWGETYNAEDDEKAEWVAGIIFKDLRAEAIRENKT